MAKCRGALLVFEGCDRAGKSTQVQLLIEELKRRNFKVATRRFPDRSTAIGSVINNFLSKVDDNKPLSAETVHLLFSANRWECRDEIIKTLQNGTTLIVDRYAGSGAAYSAATTGRSLDWCKQPDRGLPAPDGVIFLNISDRCQRDRNNFGEERFENEKTQRLVRNNFEELREETWSTIDADREPSDIHREVLEKALNIIERVKHLPIRSLYERKIDVEEI